MKIRNLACFLLVVILLATGTTPVIAHEVSQCGEVEPIRPGDSVTDAVADVPAAHIDITEVETSLSGERLTVVFHLKDLPETLRFNRTEHGEGSKEYEWEVAVDADNDRSTGPGGFDILLTAYHIAFLSHEGTDADTIAPIGEMLEAAVWEIHPGGSTSTLADADLAVSAEEETITISGYIPSITSASRLTFSAYDVEFAGEADQIECHDPYRESMGPWGCDAGAALVGPGQTVTDGIESVTDPYMDITKVSTSLSGETLTVVFHLRDVPETLTFNRIGMSESYMEYAWVVVIDVDSDRETGYGGFEYQMLAGHSVPPPEGGSNAKAPIESKVEVSVRSMEPGSSRSTEDTTLEVSSEEDTITLSGNIPGITTESRLAFRTYDYLDSFDEVGCFTSQNQSAPSSRCDTVDAVTPGQTLVDEVADVPGGHVDITEVETSLSGERLTVVFHLRDLPETLRFNRAEHGQGSKEYEWEVAIDADNDRSTGPGGFDTLLSAYHIAFLSHKGTDADTIAPIGEMLEASVWEIGADGSTSTFADADLAVSAEEETITISGYIPGITSESRLTFSAHDVQFPGDADQLACHDPYSESVGPWGCGSGATLTWPGQTVTDEIEDVTASYVDITKVSTSLSGETLTAVFHLRDVPETLTFNRTGISENYMEYGWDVSIDVDGDRETGYGGYEYELSASHFVSPFEKGSNAKASIESQVEAGVLKARSDGFMSMFDATLEVSPEENTITLSGTIPGITAESELTFGTYDYFGGSDGVGCPATPGLGAPPSTPPAQCAVGDSTVAPGQTATDDVSDVFAGYLDIVEVSTSLAGEMLTVEFRFRDIPETLTFNRTGTSANSMEYGWEVSVDVDADAETGDGGFEYLLSAYHIVWPAQEGDNTEAPIEEVAEASVWEKQPGEGIRSFRDASLEVSAEEDTIVLRGRIPGITPDSRLSFWTHGNLGGSDGVGCQDPPGLGAPPSQNAPESRCTDDDPTVAPGTTATDDISDVSAAYLDISKVSSSLAGEVLTVMFHFRDIPETLTFNRTETSANSMEYMWEVLVDVDANPETGDGGFEYLLSAHHIVWPEHAGDNTEAPIEEVAKADVWERQSGGRTSVLQDASLEVSAETDTIVLRGRIPGITPDSRLKFWTHEYLGESDGVGCQDPPGTLTSSSQCDGGGAVTPGKSVSDEVSDALAAHLDVTEISTSLSGETLTAVFHFRDVPEALTFNRAGVPGDRLEYSWEVSVDVDGDQDTGVGGFEYLLSSIHVSHGGASGRDRSAAITEDILQTNTWRLNPDGGADREIDFLEWARIEVSAEEDTVTLSGEIPGITAESLLAFGVYDYLGGAEEVGCLTPFGLGRPAQFQDPSDESAAMPGQSVSDDVSHELVGHIDIRNVTTTVDGETLTVTFHLRDVPETLTFDRTGVPEHALEYSWAVSIDVDNDPETGPGGFDYMLSAGYFVPPLAKDSNTEARMTEPGFVTAGILGLDAEGNRVLAEADIEVSAEENTITLSGEIPGITEESPLYFKAFDYFDGSVEMSSDVPSIADLSARPCRADEAAIRPGQRVVDAISDTLPAHVDITEVSTTLTGETLSVVLHLRDVPKTLEFNRKGVEENMLEYSWAVSIDVDDDREAGLQGAEYSLSASHFVFYPSNDEGVHQPIEEAVQTDIWEMDPESLGAAYLSSASVEVSSEENTITLVGDIPGITPQSRLEFEAYDFLHGSEQVACQALSGSGGGE